MLHTKYIAALTAYIKANGSKWEKRLFYRDFPRAGYPSVPEHAGILQKLRNDRHIRAATILLVGLEIEAGLREATRRKEDSDV